MGKTQERNRFAASQRSAGNPGNSKHKSPAKIKRLERRAAERAAQAAAQPINWSGEPEVVLTDAQVAEAESGPPSFETWSTAALKREATARNIPGRSKMDRGALLEALLGRLIPDSEGLVVD